MKPSVNENEVAFTMKSTIKYAFVAPGAIAKGQGKGLKSLSSLRRVTRTTIPLCSLTDQVKQYNQISKMSAIEKGQGQGLKSLSTVQGTRAVNKNMLVLEKEQMQANIPCFSSTEEVVQYIQTVGKSDLGKEQGLRDMCSFEDAENEEGSFHQNAHYTSQSMPRSSNSTKLDSTMSAAQGLRTMNKKLLVQEKEHMQVDIPISPSTDQVMQSTQTVGTRDTLGKGRGRLRDMCSFEDVENEEGSFQQNAHYTRQSMPRPSNSIKLDSTMSGAQGLRTMNKKLLVQEKEHVQADIPISPSTDQVMQSIQIVGTRDALGKGRGRLRSVCSFDDAENEEGSFHQNAYYASQSMPIPSDSTRSDSTISAARGL